MLFRKVEFYMALVLSIIATMTGCSDVKSDYKNLKISFMCMAFNCHAGTQLRIMIPVSGAHSIHMSAEIIGTNLSCESCHSDYTNERSV
jgi:hypothetical protein